jgi:hypothetical protein
MSAIGGEEGVLVLEATRSGALIAFMLLRPVSVQVAAMLLTALPFLAQSNKRTQNFRSATCYQLMQTASALIIHTSKPVTELLCSITFLGISYNTNFQVSTIQP